MDGVILDSESVCDKIWESLAEERNKTNMLEDFAILKRDFRYFIVP